MKLSIVVLTPGPSEGKVIFINAAQFVIGRDPGCQLRPASVHISKRHCALLRREEKVFLRDFGSTNGTFVNDRLIKGEIELLNGDRLRVGPLNFAVRLESSTPVDRPTPLPPAKTDTQKNGPPQTMVAEEPNKGSVDEEDAAALLLSLHESDGSGTGKPSEEVPEGSTVLELPKSTEAKADEPEKAKKPAGDTSSAAKTILDKYLKRPRST
jgi:pSer/pThr/pTyr-binding forkhead associated (FHA) protein